MAAGSSRPSRRCCASARPHVTPRSSPASRRTSSSKVERLLEALEESVAEGHKALVFSQWTSLLDLVEPALRQAAIAFTRLDGSTADRGAVVREFQDDAGPPVMLVSLKAGGTGLNLTAADHVFLLDPWWNPAVEDQAASRAHRIGQDRPVMVYRMVAKDTVEERILALQERKRRIADVALGEADQAAGITASGAARAARLRRKAADVEREGGRREDGKEDGDLASASEPFVRTPVSLFFPLSGLPRGDDDVGVRQDVRARGPCAP